MFNKKRKGTLFGKPVGQVVKHPGAFTAKANAAGMGVQQYAAKVMSNPNADPTTKRQANLARVFAGFHRGK